MDIVEGHVKALEYLNAGGNTDIFNIGAGHTHTILEVIERFQAVTGKTVDHKVGNKRPGDVNITFANNTKAQQILDWQPTRDLDTIIADAWAWETRKKK
jgi:UDP-glucose 4-epimerase